MPHRRQHHTSRERGRDIRKQKHKDHNAIEQILFEDPSLLKVGISPETLMFKATEFSIPPYAPNDFRYQAGAADLVFFYFISNSSQSYPNREFHLLALDVKSNLLDSRSFTDSSEEQERTYAEYFRTKWSTFLDRTVNPRRVCQRVPYVDGDVYLSVGLVTREMSRTGPGFAYPISLYVQDERLGRVLGTGKGLFFTE